MQVRTQKYFKERALYYLSDRYCRNYSVKNLMDDKKSKYSSLRPIYGINIVKFDCFNDQRCVHKFTLYDNISKIQYTEQDIFTLGFFEINKNDLGLSKNLQFWKQFFRYGTVSEEAPEYIKEAEKKLSISSFSKEEREMIDTIERAKEDMLAREIWIEEEAERRGMERGLQKGMEKGKKDATKMILQLVRKGLSAEEIEKQIVSQDTSE